MMEDGVLNEDLDNKKQEVAKSIGGWLRLFQVLTAISALVYVLSVVLISLGYGIGRIEFESLRDFLLFILEFLPGMIFSILIFKALPIQEFYIPSQITSYLRNNLLLSFLIALLLSTLYQQGMVSDKPGSVFGSIVYFAIWALYFKKSKRVREYYGDNA